MFLQFCIEYFQYYIIYVDCINDGFEKEFSDDIVIDEFQQEKGIVQFSGFDLVFFLYYSDVFSKDLLGFLLKIFNVFYVLQVRQV